MVYNLAPLGTSGVAGFFFCFPLLYLCVWGVDYCYLPLRATLRHGYFFWYINGRAMLFRRSYGFSLSHFDRTWTAVYCTRTGYYMLLPWSFLEVILKLLWSTSIWIGYDLEITKVENVMHGICELYRPIKKFLTPNWCTFLHLCSSYSGTMLWESLLCLLSLDFVGFTAIKQGTAFDRFPLINLRVCVRRFKWEVFSVRFVGFFSKMQARVFSVVQHRCQQRRGQSLRQGVKARPKKLP